MLAISTVPPSRSTPECVAIRILISERSRIVVAMTPHWLALYIVTCDTFESTIAISPADGSHQGESVARSWIPPHSIGILVPRCRAAGESGGIRYRRVIDTRCRAIGFAFAVYNCFVPLLMAGRRR